MTMKIEHDANDVRLSARSALALALGHHNPLKHMRAVEIVAYTAAIALVTTAISAFDATTCMISPLRT